MIIHPEPQGTIEWLTARAGVVTASEFSDFMTSKFELREGEMLKTATMRKVAEKWLGGPLPGFQSLDMELGAILEDECIPTYEFRSGESVQRVGLITTDCGRVGCSPDGLIGETAGVEAKCPKSETHLKYLLGGKLPADYVCQVHGALFVTGRQSWRFVSYARRFPMFVLNIERNQEIMDKIEECVLEFVAMVDSAFQRLCDLNGGPPKRHKRELIEPEKVAEAVYDADVPH